MEYSKFNNIVKREYSNNNLKIGYLIINDRFSKS